MNSFIAYLNKELIEGIRSYKFLILFLGIFFFAIFNPVILKLTPVILSSQTEMDISGLFQLSKTAAIESFFGDLFEITSFIIVLTLMGIIAGEKKEKSLIIPYCSGAEFSGIIAAKLTVYISAVIIFLVLSIVLNFYYSEFIFGPDSATLIPIMKAVLTFSVYFAFIITLITFLSSFFSKGIIPAFISLFVIYLLPLLSTTLKFSRFTPMFLAIKSAELKTLNETDFSITIYFTLFYTSILAIGTIISLKQQEL